MRILSSMLALAVSVFLWIGTRPAAAAESPSFPKFKTQEIDNQLKIGYAVLTPDINGDKKPDIVVVDQFQVVWYENPSWKKHVILDGKTKPDNVCAAPVDINGDGKVDLVLGAAWKPSDTLAPGTLQWLKNPGVAGQEWKMFPIPCEEPTVHRVRAFDIDGDGKPEIVHVPLQGRGCTFKGKFTDGKPVRIMAYKIPKNPEASANWKPTVLSEELHVCHNFWPVPARARSESSPLRKAPRGNDVLVASYEGAFRLAKGVDNQWRASKIGVGNQANPGGRRGASEIKYTQRGNAEHDPRIATIEPWHGNQVVVYTHPGPGSGSLWKRHVLDDHLRWGHAVWFADLDGDGSDELVIGVRDNPGKGDPFTEKRGIRVYKNSDRKGEKWNRLIVDNGGIACEDMTVADLNGDGKPDIIACGRATKNVRIYWNQGK